MQQFEAAKVIFDLDGTLVDTAPDLLAATNYVLSELGRPKVSLAQVRHMVGHGAMRLIELGLEATGGAGEDDLEALKDVFIDYYKRHICVSSIMFPEAEQVLHQLKSKGFEMAICTNKPIALAKELLAALNIKHLFGAVVGGDSFPYKKPDPRHILSAAALLPGDGAFVMVGDSKPDIDAARSAAVPSFLVTFGYSAHPHNELGADIILSEMSALPDHLILDAT